MLRISPQKQRRLPRSALIFPSRKVVAKPDDVEMSQLTLFDTVREDDIIKEIREMELGQMTPIDALNLLYRFQTKLNNRWEADNKAT